MSEQKKITSQETIKKQQLFVNPLTLINQQQPSITQNNQCLIEMNSTRVDYSNTDQINNFNQFLINTVQSNTQPLSKTKIILKSQPPNKIKYYRTSICPYGIQCKKRLTCNYAHNQSQLRKPYKNRKNLCIRYQKGLCGLGAACPDYHGNMDLKKKNYKYKTLPCKDWHEKGHCPKGQLCIFIHNEQKVQIQSQPIQNEQIGVQKQLRLNSEVQQNNLPKDQSKKNDQPKENKKPPIMIGEIFKSTNKKTVTARQVIEQRIQQKNDIKQDQLKPSQQDENFNIEFNF